MKKLEFVFATTHVDRHQERISLEGLESIAEKMSTSYLPFTAEHDPRNYPIGRVISARIRSRTDGEHEIVADVEVWETGDKPPFTETGRKLAIPKHGANGLTVSFDRTYRFDEDQADISDIAHLFGNSPVEQVKKSLDPISIIEITGTFVLSSIAAGFFGQIGADGWNALKSKLANLFRRTDKRSKGQLLILKGIIQSDRSDEFEVQIIFTDPTDDDIERTLPGALKLLDTVLPLYHKVCPEAGRFVFEVMDGEPELKYLIRTDCVPLFPTFQTKEILAHIEDETTDRTETK